MIKRFLVDEEGQTLVEYGLLISVIALVVVSALIVMGKRLRSGYNAATPYIATATS